MHWDSLLFTECYNSIRLGNEVDPKFIKEIEEDLFNILIVPPKNESSRNKILQENTPVTFSDGQEYKLNQPFIEAAVVLSTELGLDELVTAEILYLASDLKFEKGTLLVDSARLEYYTRQQLVLNILGNLLENDKIDLIVSQGNHEKFFNNIIKSFEKIYETLDTLDDLVDKQKLTAHINDISFICSINFTKSQLFTNHELLGQIYYTLINNYETYRQIDYFNSIIKHIKKHLSDDDVLVIHFLPGLFKFVSNGFCDFALVHALLTSTLTQDYLNILNNDTIDLSKSQLKGFEILVIFYFLTNFIGWCKDMEPRTTKFNFKDDVLKYIEWCINYGVMDKLLCYCADTSTLKTQELLDWSNMYDFRALLQKTYPKLSPLRFTLRCSSELIHASAMRPEFENVKKLTNVSNYNISSTFVENLVVPFLHSFFSQFIINSAVILTLLRDNEEDFLLSSINKKEPIDAPSNIDDDDSTKRLNNGNGVDNDSLDLEEISSRADLERFYLALAYCYSDRPEICLLFLSVDEPQSDILGFITWGLSNNTSPLITSTFCLLLGSLTSGGSESSCKVWEILNNNSSTLKKNDYSRISIESIIDSLTYYVEALNENFEQDLSEQLKQQQKRQDFFFSTNIQNQQQENLSSTEVIIELAEDSIIFISGFIQLISSIVRNLAPNESERFKDIKTNAFNRFKGVIIEFLKFDNLIISSKGLLNSLSANSNRPSSSEAPRIQISDENRVILTNLLLNLLADFVSKDDNLNLRYQIWTIVDKWIYQALFITNNNDGTNSNHEKNEDEIASNTRDGNNLLRKAGKRVDIRGSSEALLKNPRLKLFYGRQHVRINQGFQINLTHFSQVANFAKLLRNLLSSLDVKNKAFAKFNLLYPADLGESYRINNQIGVWPYIEYLLLEVFSYSDKLNDLDDKFNLQLIVVETIQNSLNDVDWVFINDIAPHAVKEVKNLNSIVQSNNALSYHLFIKLHHSLAILNYLYDEKAYSALSRIVNVGVDELDENEKLVVLVEKTLSVVVSILDLQDTYINRLLPILKDGDDELAKISPSSIGINTNMNLTLNAPKSIFDNIYYPKNIGTNGISNYYEIFLFNLSAVVHLALYVGTSNSYIANLSVRILNKLSSSEYFIARISYNPNDPLLTKNRLLTIFETIDESIKIKFSFMKQFEAYNDDLEIRYNILNFLLDNLTVSNGKEPNVAHFLLGFQLRGGNLLFKDFYEENSLLNSLLNTLGGSLDFISEINYNEGNNRIVNVAPARLSSLILRILVKLCRDPISSEITLCYLRNNGNLFERLIDHQPNIDQSTVFHEHTFNGDLREDVDNKFIHDQSGRDAFFSFIDYRNLVLQYLSLEFHSVPSMTRKEHYVKSLLGNKDYLDGSPKVLNLLDILNFNFKNSEIHKYEIYNETYNMGLILQEAKASKSEAVDLTILSKVVKFVCQSSNLRLKEEKVAFSKQVMFDAYQLSEFVTKVVIAGDLKDAQLKCLHSWCQLIEILITDGIMDSKSFVLEIFQVLLPKINDYLESAIIFSEEFISLSVLLFDVYEQKILKKCKREEFSIEFRRLLPLFKTCISGILNTNSTPSLRSDLYILTNKFLVNLFNKDELVREISGIIKSTDKRFIDVICNDSIYSEGPSRITSILLLESLIHLSSLNKNNFILDLLIKNNSLLMLVRSIKRTDQMISICSDENSGISLETLLYELTAFKSTMYFLLRVAQSKAGSLQLIQSELFPILRLSKFLQIDPDVGLTLKLGETKDFNNIKVSLSLDTPYALADLNKNAQFDNDISYFEFLNPTFQLVVAVLLSMGPSFRPSIIQTREMLKDFHYLLVGIMKRDYLVETKQLKSDHLYKDENISLVGLKELVKLFTLLNSLVSEKGV
ncbi:uncharacterized protein PRCAT00006339001 [Priceomyces carsonii]|uniref:uncharacterized protein n=1 Tax=Priceomyces carsonii TaxID=28549 RepID=UPI002ED7E28D|nr:unnamed protein product [Priceomyces carsonii]